MISDFPYSMMGSEVGTNVCPPGLEITTEKECLEVWEANNANNGSLFDLFQETGKPGLSEKFLSGEKREWMDVRLFLNGGNIGSMGFKKVGFPSNWHEMEQNFGSAWHSVPFGCSYCSDPFMIPYERREPAFIFNNYEKTTKGLTTKGTKALYFKPSVMYISDVTGKYLGEEGPRKWYNPICKKGKKSKIHFE